ncbi:hypothetical protein LSH36_1219g00003 [Paralvinella palmiformis]|uniref:Probable arginine--tRNA ligase, mitochondrial n=1 Tax=Paralvinella palmiformis TaxID=53620 RepID=A0AAD9MQZ6_9ANNE|nr:hypothetical protein LSH36_1219g00003 [Paralvinella palmiformis]
MAHFLREKIATKLCKHVPSLLTDGQQWSELSAVLPWCLKFMPTEMQRRRSPNDNGFKESHLLLDYSCLKHLCQPYGIQVSHIQDWAKTAAGQLAGDELFADVRAKDHRLEFAMKTSRVLKDCLHEIISNDNYGFHSKFHQYLRDRDGKLYKQKKNQTVVLEYSSPNIAKPFHAGHLRSTIMGNIIGNLFEQLGHTIIRINYLGNWGTQFGLLGAGYEKYGKKEEMDKDPLKYLLQLYIEMNKKAELDETVLESGRQFAARMEQGEEKALSLWKLFLDKSLEEYTKIYERLGIKFDVYDGEANQVQAAQKVVEELKEKGLLQYKDGLGYVDLIDEKGKSAQANIIRKDGTTLYLTRDIAAAVNRYNKYEFDRLLYFVEAGQDFHFKKLFLVLQKLGYEWATGPHGNFHIRFGRIRGMSTRKGNIVLLRELLDTARETMLENMHNTETTKQCSNEQETAEVLGKSGLIIQDIKQRRILDYEFSWTRMLSNKGNTGVALQYVHARLANIEKNCDIDLDINCDVGSLLESSAVNLILHLAQKVTNVAVGELHVKGEPDINKAKARLLMFHCTRLVLASSLRTLGIQPLDEF